MDIEKLKYRIADVLEKYTKYKVSGIVQEPYSELKDKNGNEINMRRYTFVGKVILFEQKLNSYQNDYLRLLDKRSILKAPETGIVFYVKEYQGNLFFKYKDNLNSLPYYTVFNSDNEYMHGEYQSIETIDNYIQYYFK